MMYFQCPLSLSLSLSLWSAVVVFHYWSLCYSSPISVGKCGDRAGGGYGRRRRREPGREENGEWRQNDNHRGAVPACLACWVAHTLCRLTPSGWLASSGETPESSTHLTMFSFCEIPFPRKMMTWIRISKFGCLINFPAKWRRDHGVTFLFYFCL
jgi:hypothetical protein